MRSVVHRQEGFAGGLNTLLDSSQLEANEYRLLLNARARFGRIDPVVKPLQVSDGLPAGKRQGCYAVGNFGIVFVAGKAYYKDYSTAGSSFIEIADFQMDATVDTLYAQDVPASTVNFLRKSAGTVDAGVTLQDTTTASPRAFVIQDGINQPWVIFPDGSARETGVYNTWSVDNREYVPIGTLMAYVGGVLYIVSGREIYRSVSGRPLDFVVAIAADGDKISASESEGGASVTSFHVSHDDVSAILPNGSDVGGLIVCTTRSTKFVLPNFNSTIYGEPTYDVIPLFSTGALNQFSAVDILGDIAFVDLSGIRSFNAVRQLKNDGQNAPFSLKIASLFEGIEQDVVAAASFDNYDLFSVNTVHGPAVLVFDELIRQFVAIDIYEGLGQIKQFAVVKTAIQRKLIFITEDDEFYEAFQGSEREEAGFFFGERVVGEAKFSQDLVGLKLIFTDVTEAGFVRATPYVDEEAGVAKTRELVQTEVIPASPRPLPFDNASDTVKTLYFNLKDDGLSGNRVGCWLRWNFAAKLLAIELEANLHKGRVEQREQAVEFGRPVLSVELGQLTALVGEVIYLNGTGLTAVTAVKFPGDLGCSFSIVSDNQIRLFVPVGAETGQLILELDSYKHKLSQTLTIE